MEIYQRLFSEQIGSPRGMLSAHDTSFAKKGRHSVGVKRQYCGCLGKTESCQCGVFLAYAGDKGYGLVDYQLYIPQEWSSDPAYPWETVILGEGAKGPITAEWKAMRCFSGRKDLNRNYVRPGGTVWLYADGEILKKSIPLTVSMVVQLTHGIITYVVTDMKKIVCYHIRRDH